MKLCTDCKHVRLAPQGLNANEYSRCLYGLAISPVTGKHEIVTQNFIYAIGCRQSNAEKDCGPDARYFECGRFLAEDDEARCGDEGRLCETCFQDRAKEHEWMRGKPLSAVTGILSDEEKQELRDAGRGHLVAP